MSGTDSMPSPTSAAFFERMYSSDADHDPWNFATDGYERGRYRTLLDVLPRSRYASAFEPGCSIGELSAQLAPRCERLIAMDLAPTAVATAVRRHGDLPNVDFRCGDLADDLDPLGSFDLVVLSEIGYYFTRRQLVDVAERVFDHLESDGDLVAAHWTGHSKDHILDGEFVHDVLAEVATRRGAAAWFDRRHHDGFVLDGWRMP